MYVWGLSLYTKFRGKHQISRQCNSENKVSFVYIRGLSWSPNFRKRRNTFLPFMMQHKEEKHMNLRTNCGRRFTTIGTDSTTISSACTYAPSAGLEGVTQIIPLSLYNKLYNYLISFVKNEN